MTKPDAFMCISVPIHMLLSRGRINLSSVFAGQDVGISEVSEKIWLVSFMSYDLGFFDHESGRVECAQNPFGAKVLPMCPAGINRYPCVRNGPVGVGAG
jgi:hypothetical protein